MDLEYDDIAEIDGHYHLVCEGRPVADFHQLLEAYEEQRRSWIATRRILVKTTSTFRGFAERVDRALLMSVTKSETIDAVQSAVNELRERWEMR